MNYPYTELVPLLQILTTPKQYENSTPKWKHAKIYTAAYNSYFLDYWSLLPRYKYARCPFCSQEYQEPVDTYTLKAWGGHSGLRSHAFALDQYPAPKACDHFMGVHRFINLHGNAPNELRYFDNPSAEVPYLTPWFFADDVQTRPVLHALPICRVKRQDFIPTYTAFFLTYFSEDPAEIKRRYYAVQHKFAENDPDYYPYDIQSPWSENDQLYDLPNWAERGLLGWLDFRESYLPLRIGEETALPKMYQHIEGDRRPLAWRK